MENQNPNPNPNQNQLHIQVRPEIAEGKYTNLAMIGHSSGEFIFDFMFVVPGFPQSPMVVSRLLMTPENAKKLLLALTDNIKKYESQFGEISPRPGKIGNN